MPENGLLGLLLNGFANATSGSASRGNSDSGAEGESGGFMKIMKSMMNGAGEAKASTGETRSAAGQNGASAGNAAADMGLSASRTDAGVSDGGAQDATDEAIVAERLAVLKEKGVLREDVLEDATPEEMEELAAWVLAGAGGMFPPVDVPAESLNMNAVQGMLDFLASDAGQGVMAAISFSTSAEMNSGMEMEALLEALRQAMGENADGLNLDALESMPVEQLAQKFASLMEALGITEDAGGLDALPDAVLRSLALTVTDAGETLDAGMQLLDRLGGASMMSEELRNALKDKVADAEMPVEAMQDEEIVMEVPETADDAAGDLADEMLQDLSADEMEVGKPADSLAEDAEATLTLEETETTLLDEVADVPDMAADQKGTVVEELAARTEANTTDALREVQAAAARAQANASAQTASQAAMVENVERVERLMQMATQRGIQHVSLQLSPPELGRVSIHMEMKAGVLNATLQAETADARHALLAGVEQLRENLQVQGVRLEGFEVNLGQEYFPEDQAGRWAGAQQQRGQNRGGGGASSGDEGVGAVESAPAQDTYYVGDGAVNVVA